MAFRHFTALPISLSPPQATYFTGNCSNIGVAQAKWSNNNPGSGLTSVPVASPAAASVVVEVLVAEEVKEIVTVGSSFLKSDGSLTVHAVFKKTANVLDFKEKRVVRHEYGRYGNPTTFVLEKKISALEGAESTLVMASGMCATTVMLFALVPRNGHIVTTKDYYRKTRIFMETFLPKFGITVTVIDPADTAGLEAVVKKHEVSLFLTESPTNPFLRCVDIELVSEICHKRGTLVCIDGTFATPLNQKALALGADLVVHSATKYIGGHNDVLGGCVCGSMELVSEIRNLHHVLGGTLNPVQKKKAKCFVCYLHRLLLCIKIYDNLAKQNAAYLLIRGLKTMHLRVKQQNSTALRMAQVLETHPKVSRVYYPGLPSHPEHHIAKRQMTGFGGVVSFEITGDLETTIKFVDSLKIPYIAPSFGGCESIVDQPAIMSYWDLPQEERLKYGINDNLVRFSFGIEDFADIKADVLHALDTI